MQSIPEIRIELQDIEWPLTYTDHDRETVRAIVVDDGGYCYFVRAVRDDEFGAATLIETSGGGVERGEDLSAAIRRELREELGAEVDILAKIGVVSDYYNLIHRHNINHYFLCRVLSDAQRYNADILLVMLGTNDLLEGAGAAEAASRMKAFLAGCTAPRIVLISPPPMRRGAWVPDDQLVEESGKLAREYAALAEHLGIQHIDAGKWDIGLAFDGVHFSEEGHVRFAHRLATMKEVQS